MVRQISVEISQKTRVFLTVLAFESVFYDEILAVRLRYAVVMIPMPALTLCRTPPITYTAWLPPFQRSVSIQRLPDAPEPQFTR